MAQPRNFTRFAWGVLAFNLFVVLWGAFVRATGSGAGCGNHWPLCNGEVVPRSPRLETIIEFTHRATSGIALVLVAALVVWAFRVFPRKHPVRLGAVLSAVFLFTEALIGAGLVLFQQVAGNASAARGFWLSIHLINTLTLLAVLALTAWWASGRPSLDFRRGGPALWVLGSALAGFVILGISGAIAALGDTLFPAASLTAGFAQDFSPSANIFLRLRVFHPVIAMLAGGWLLFAAWFTASRRPQPLTRSLGFCLAGLVMAQWMLGAINIAMLAPTWMQLVHLLFADLVWLAAVLFSASAFARRESGRAAASGPVLD